LYTNMKNKIVSLLIPDSLQQMVETSLPQRSREILPWAQASLRLNIQPVDQAWLPPGGSHLGGQADLPPDCPWPAWQGQPLAFLAQINLAELAGFPAAAALPPGGWLSFFYCASQEAWGDSLEESGAWRVIYTPAEARLELQALASLGSTSNDSAGTDARQAADTPWVISFQEEWCLPPFDAPMINTLQFDEQENDQYSQLLEQLSQPDEGGSIHRLLGHPDPLQYDMRLHCHLASQGLDVVETLRQCDAAQRQAFETASLDWRLLLQLDSDAQAGIKWGESGRLYFCIPAEDLAQCRFDRVWMVLQDY
jgi:uncharacterized protein YwqG